MFLNQKMMNLCQLYVFICGHVCVCMSVVRNLHMWAVNHLLILNGFESKDLECHSSATQQKILDIITSLTLKSSSSERNVNMGKAAIPVKRVTFLLYVLRVLSDSPLSLFSAVVRSQRPCLVNFPDIYETRLGGIVAIPAKHTSKSHYSWHSKQASTLGLKISIWKEHQSIWCPHLSDFLSR